MDRQNNSAQKKIPGSAYIMIIGAMKSGTTSLYNYLKHHPEICPCLTKEPEYFSKKQSHGVSAEAYEDLFDFDADQHKFALEASTGYSKFPYESGVPGRIKAYGLSPKFIYVIRNPFDRIASQFNHVHKDEKHLSFDDMFTHLIDNSKYCMQINEYLKVFPKQNFMLIDFDDLKRDPIKILTEVYGFVGISNNYYPDDLSVFNKTTGLGKKSRLLQRKIDSKLSFLPASVRKAMKLIIKLRYKTKSIVLDDSQIKLIYEAIKEDMLELKVKHGFETSNWGF